jgi:hypothetical protein
MSFKRSCHCRHSLRALGSRNRSSSNLLWKKRWRLSHNGLLLRMPLGGSRRIKRTSCRNIFLQNIVITKKKYCILTGRKIEVKNKKTSARKWRNLRVQGIKHLEAESINTCRCNGYWGIPVHLLLGPVIGPSSVQGRIADPSYGEDPHEEAPREENDDGRR